MNSLFNVESSDCDPRWQKIRDSVVPELAKIKDKLQALWESYEPYADKNFRQEFAINTHQRFWEMYLASHLLREGKNLVPRNHQNPTGPDILIEEEGRRIWVEAVAPTPGASDNPNKVSPMLVDGQGHGVPDNELLLRATSQLSEKREKFLQYHMNGIVAQDDLCIIGINCGDMNGFEALEASSINSAFYPTREIWGDGTMSWGKPVTLIKSSGEPIRAGVFTSAAFEPIAGAIFSSDSISSLLKSETDFRYFPNPRSSHLLPPKWIPWSEETIATESEAGLVMEILKNDETIAKVTGPFPSFDTQ